jgi:K+-sensing histidine kinase KdpD
VERLPQHDERKQIKELIDYYKVVFTTLANCASHQLGEVIFRRAVVKVPDLMEEVAHYHAKAIRKYPDASKIHITVCETSVNCDPHLILFLMEQLVDAALATSPTDSLALTAESEGEFVRFALENSSQKMSREALQTLFAPSPERVACMPDGKLAGMEYIIAREIMREHDGYFGHIGCRINAEPTSNGYTVWFTIPEVK